MVGYRKGPMSGRLWRLRIARDFRALRGSTGDRLPPSRGIHRHFQTSSPLRRAFSYTMSRSLPLWRLRRARHLQAPDWHLRFLHLPRESRPWSPDSRDGKAAACSSRNSDSGHVDLPTGGHENSPGTASKTPHGRSREFPRDGHENSPLFLLKSPPW